VGTRVDSLNERVPSVYLACTTGVPTTDTLRGAAVAAAALRRLQRSCHADPGRSGGGAAGRRGDVARDFTTTFTTVFLLQSLPQSSPSLLHCSRKVDISAVKTVSKDDIDLDLSHALQLPVDSNLLPQTVDSNLLQATRSLHGFFLVLRRLFNSVFARVRQVKVLTKKKICEVSTLVYLLFTKVTM